MPKVNLREGKTAVYGAVRITIEEIDGRQVRLNLRQPRRIKIVKQRPKQIDSPKDGD